MLLSNFAMKLAGVSRPPPLPHLLVAEEILHTTVHNPMHLATVTQYRIVHTITLAVWEPA